MSRWDELKKVKDTAKAKLDEADLKKLAGDAVIGASNVADGAESVARRSGLTKKNGEISKLRVAKAAVQPRKTARTLLGATADEVRARREATPADDVPDPDEA
jgi:hypothetical protein